MKNKKLERGFRHGMSLGACNPALAQVGQSADKKLGLAAELLR